MARRILPLAKERFASPLEVATYAILALPPRYGGISFPAPENNPSLYLDGPSGMGGGRIEVIPDMLFPDMKMVSECDGRAFHGFEDSCVSDRSRWRNYSLNGYSVMPVTYADLARIDSSDDLIESVIAAAGHGLSKGER